MREHNLPPSLNYIISVYFIQHAARKMRAIFGSQNACYYRALRSIKGEGCPKRASCFSDHEDNHCLVFAMSYYDLRKRDFG